jgi:hypothetical protein
MSIRSSSAVNGVLPCLAGCADPTSRIVPRGGPAGQFSGFSNSPIATELSINFQDTDPGGLFFRAWSAIMISACLSNRTISPPFAYGTH